MKKYKDLNEVKNRVEKLNKKVCNKYIKEAVRKAREDERNNKIKYGSLKDYEQGILDERKRCYEEEIVFLNELKINLFILSDEILDGMEDGQIAVLKRIIKLKQEINKK